MHRSWVPTIVLAGIGLPAGGIYCYFADDPDEATLVDYIRSSLHGMASSLPGWAVHVYFTLRYMPSNAVPRRADRKRVSVLLARKRGSGV
jgi:hypothetical protein